MEKSLDVVIVGGSIAGLMHGIVLKRLGHNVRILEQHCSHVRESQAAGIRAGPQADLFMKTHDLTHSPYSIESAGLQQIDRDSVLKRFRKWPMQMTSWSTLYYCLRANFDGFESETCSLPPSARLGDGKVEYELGKEVVAYTFANDRITLHYNDVATGDLQTVTADLVIAADGANSRMRQWVVEKPLKRPEAGYIAWRGNVIESEVSEKTKNLCKSNCTFFKMPRNYILVYLIPGKNGSLKPGERSFNFVWYYNIQSDTPEYHRIMTDRAGKTHRYTLPPGQMADEVWAIQKAYARTVLAEPFLELIEKTKQPFVTAISDTIMPRATYCNNRLLFVGDAFALFRPHAALSANQAARSALELERVMRGEKSIVEWEREAVDYGRKFKAVSSAIGTFGQFGKWELVKAVLRLGVVMASQLVMRWWWKISQLVLWGKNDKAPVW